MKRQLSLLTSAIVVLLFALGLYAQPPGNQQQPEFVRQGQQLVRQGKLEEALAVYREGLRTAPDSVAGHLAAGVVLDLLGRGSEAREHFAKAIAAAPTPQLKANAQRQLAMSYAFENDCRNAARTQQEVFDYYVAQKDFYQQGEMANEVARVCLEAGDFDAAEKWYRLGYESGLKEPGIKPDRVALWKFRWEHAQARLAARRGQHEKARQHVSAAKAILDSNPAMAQAQKIFYPYLTSYVAFYAGDYKTALAELQQANQNDPFIQVLIGQTYEKLGQQDKAREYYRKAAETTAHNPPAAYARPFARGKLAGK